MNICKYCGDEIRNTHAPECDKCWEIQWHCIVNPELVAKILKDSQEDWDSTKATDEIKDCIPEDRSE